MLSRVKKQPKSAVRKRRNQHRCEGRDSESVEEAADGASRLPGKSEIISRWLVVGFQMSLTICFSADVTKSSRGRCVRA